MQHVQFMLLYLVQAVNSDQFQKLHAFTQAACMFLSALGPTYSNHLSINTLIEAVIFAVVTYVVVDMLVHCLVRVLVSMATSMSRDKLFKTKP